VFFRLSYRDLKPLSAVCRGGLSRLPDTGLPADRLQGKLKNAIQDGGIQTRVLLPPSVASLKAIAASEPNRYPAASDGPMTRDPDRLPARKIPAERPEARCTPKPWPPGRAGFDLLQGSRRDSNPRADRICRPLAGLPPDRLHEKLKQPVQVGNGVRRLSRSSRPPWCARRLRGSWQIEYQQQGVLDGAQLVVRQVCGSVAERASVDGADHLAEDLRRLVVDRDLGMEAGRERRARGRADDDRGEGEQIVGLDDHRVAAALLGVLALAWELDAMDITADHAWSP